MDRVLYFPVLSILSILFIVAILFTEFQESTQVLLMFISVRSQSLFIIKKLFKHTSTRFVLITIIICLIEKIRLFPSPLFSHHFKRQNVIICANEKRLHDLKFIQVDRNYSMEFFYSLAWHLSIHPSIDKMINSHHRFISNNCAHFIHTCGIFFSFHYYFVLWDKILTRVVRTKHVFSRWVEILWDFFTLLKETYFLRNYYVKISP